MFKFTFIATIATLAFISQAQATSGIQSVYTDTDSDCVIVSSATDQAPIDFYESQCKSFGGYTLGIKGSDLRYSPVLTYNNIELELQRPMSFHDMASAKIEWLYIRDWDEEGSGTIQWKGMIYHLAVANEEGVDEEKVFAVRLQNEKTCVLGVVSADDSARKLIMDDSLVCK